MSAKVDSYAGSGHIQATFASQLSYRLSIIKLLVSQGSMQTAIDYMNDFLAYIRDPSVQQQGLLSGRALGDLVSSAQHWIHGN
jgi:hypothetical protein